MYGRILPVAAPLLVSSALAFAPRVFARDTDDGAPVVGALGDSLSAGFNAKHLGDNRDLAWCTGGSPLVRSHLQRLEDFFGVKMAADNEAIAGSKAADLERQTTRLLPHHPAYVTVTIGANDVCTWPTSGYEPKLQKFQDDVRATLSRLITAEPGIKITVAPIPNVYNLWEIAHDKPSCQLKWDITGMCDPLLHSEHTQAERLAFVERWKQTNDALAAVAADFGDNVLFNENAIDTPFTWEHVSPIDCFHPSILGQNLLAEKTWFYGQ